MSVSGDASNPSAGGGETPELEAVGFEAALADLEQVVRDLEEGRLGLNASLDRYEHGVRRLKQCYQLLEHAQERIEMLSTTDVEGQARVEVVAFAVSGEGTRSAAGGGAETADARTGRSDVKRAPSAATAGSSRASQAAAKLGRTSAAEAGDELSQGSAGRESSNSNNPGGARRPSRRKRTADDPTAAGDSTEEADFAGKDSRDNEIDEPRGLF